MMTRRGYLAYEPSVEHPSADERQAIETILASIRRTSAASAESQGQGIRQQHAKAHGFLRGELQVYDDLPRHLAQGLFAAPRRYPVIVRLSTAFGDIRTDRVRVPRGMAIKVLDVPGAKALADDPSSNQDFLLVNHRNYFSDAKAYLFAQRLFEVQPKLPDLVLRGFGLGARIWVRLAALFDAHAPMIVYPLADPGADIVGETFYSEGALRFGDHVARLSAAPVSHAALSRRGRGAHDADDALQRSVVAFFQSQGAEYELRAQLCVDLKHTPLEDAFADWPEEVSPFQPVARIVIPQQTADSPARRDYAQNVLSFSPWRCLADHQPLGSIMRIRKEAYRLSAELRHQTNCRPLTEPRDISEFPD